MDMIVEPRVPLFREVLGSHLQQLRFHRGERLSDVARRAGISTQYLSEIERGRKDPSSEMIEAVAGALDTSVADVSVAVGELMGAVVAPAARLDSGEPVRVARGGAGSVGAYALAA
ncbi:helix-turn-helix domain-containing protein [Gordonia sp. MP11Mi]|uniref:HTH cro/C1-type domain-containing protein n=1 Tax=Gordonia sp. MP11Mi TaxID=3022769 RepID=A0AA97GUM9_9ACTN